MRCALSLMLLSLAAGQDITSSKTRFRTEVFDISDMPRVPRIHDSHYTLRPNVDNCPNSKSKARGGCYLDNIEGTAKESSEAVLQRALDSCSSNKDCGLVSCGYDVNICNGKCFSCTLQMAYDPLLTTSKKPKFFCDLRWAMYVKEKDASGLCGCNKICQHVNPRLDTTNEMSDGEFLTLPCSCHA